VDETNVADHRPAIGGGPVTARRQWLLGFVAAALTATATQAAAPGIAVAGAWARPTPPGATTGGVYLSLTNHGAVADALVSATSPAATKVEFHAMKMAAGVMTMREINGPIAIPPGASLRFAPGGNHIMLVGLKAQLRAGARVPLTLTFSRAGAVKVDAVVQMEAPASAMAGMKM
jgi:copper(I)-binding protein